MYPSFAESGTQSLTLMLCKCEYSSHSRDLALAWPSCHVCAATTGKNRSWVQRAFFSKPQPDNCKEAILHILKLAIRGHSWLWGKQLGSHLSYRRENMVIMLLSGNWHHCQATSELLRMYFSMLSFPEFLCSSNHRTAHKHV